MTEPSARTTAPSDPPVGDRPASEPPTPKRLVEYVLDPRSLQALMSCGGGLLVLGLVIWLWTLKFFENPLVLASCLGAGNLALLAGGVALVKLTRYQTAGRAVTFLASLILPLNLWFYDSQGLVTLADGGHLWVPAVVCCGLYALVARLLKDSLFVYTIVGGVTMTGLLLLADNSVNRFWEVLSPSTFLVLLGVVCVHAERLFTKEPGPFSRNNFGKAFFQSGHAVLGGGLLLLLAGRLVGWMYVPLNLVEHVWFEEPGVATVLGMKLVALLLALVGTYTYVFSQLVRGSGRRYAVSAVLMLLWSEVILLDLLAVHVTESVLLLALASTALAANVAARLNRRRDEALDQLTRTAGVVGRWLTTAVVAWGSVAVVRGMVHSDMTTLPFTFNGAYLVAMVVAGLATLVAGETARRLGNDRQASDYFRLLGPPAVGALATLCSMVGGFAPEVVLAVAMALVVVTELVAARASHSSLLRQLSFASTTATVFMLLLSLPVVAGWSALVVSPTATHLVLAAFYAQAAALLGWQAVRYADRTSVGTSATLAGVSGTAAVWQLLLTTPLDCYAPVVAASVVGATMVWASRLLLSDEETSDDAAAWRHMLLHNAGGVLVSLGGAGGLLLTLSEVMFGQVSAALLALATGQAVAAGLAALATKSSDWRRWLYTLGSVHVLAGLLVLNVLSQLSFVNRVELFLVVGGLLMLVAGHLGWRKEGSEPDALVSFNLGMGSLLASTPLVVGLLVQRLVDDSHWAWLLMHEVGVLSVGLGLLAVGVLCRVRWTTVVGAGTLAMYVASLLLLVDFPDRLQTVSVYMMVGGGVFFGGAVLLSVYRDRLLALPQRVRDGKGVFRVMHWR